VASLAVALMVAMELGCRELFQTETRYDDIITWVID